MESTKKKPSRFGWLFLLIPSLVIPVVAVLGRRQCYIDAGRDWDATSIWILFLIGGVALLVNWFFLLRRNHHRVVKIISGIAFSLTALGLLFMLSLRSSAVRYQLQRYETLHRNLGITHREKGLREELLDEILDPGTGPRIVRDEELLRTLALKHGRHFREHPREAQVAYAALQEFGIRFEDVLHEHGSNEFLSAVLHAETNPKAWSGLDAYPRPELDLRENEGFHAGLLSLTEAEKIVAQERASGTPESQEHLLYFLIGFPMLFDEVERAAVRTGWENRFPEMQDFVRLGFELIELIREEAGSANPLRLHLSVYADQYLKPTEWDRNDMKSTIERTMLGIVRMAAANVELVPESEADLVLKVEGGLEHTRDRDVDVVVGERVRVPAGRRFLGRGISISQYRTEYQTRVVGTKSQAVLDASVLVGIDGKGEPLVIGEELFYWYDHIVAAKYKSAEENKGQQINWSGVYQTYGKRIWPLGLREDLFQFNGPVEETDEAASDLSTE